MKQRDNHGRHELHHAALRGDATRIREIKQAVVDWNLDEADDLGAYANSKDNHYETALHMAARGGHDAAVLALIEPLDKWHIIPVITNSRGETPRDVGANTLKPETLSALAEAEQRRYPTAPKVPVELSHVARLAGGGNPELLAKLARAAKDDFFDAADEQLPFAIAYYDVPLDEVKAFLKEKDVHVHYAQIREQHGVVFFEPSRISGREFADALEHPRAHLEDMRPRDVALTLSR